MEICLFQHTFCMQNDQSSENAINRPERNPLQTSNDHVQFNNLFKQTAVGINYYFIYNNLIAN